MKKLLITNVAYGDTYTDLFLNQHLKSLLDSSNIPSFKERVQYSIFTDAASFEKMAVHENFLKLCDLINVKYFLIDVATSLSFENRYGILIQTFGFSVREALAADMYLSAVVADLVFAQGYIGKLFQRLDEGYDSVFVLPMRTAMEAMVPLLPKEGALLPLELFNIGYASLHPLWVACHFDTPQFTKLPFSLLWNTGTGLLAKSFSITPIAFTPSENMLATSQVIDVEVPSLCKNPYWATDWTECPVIGVEPLQCYYPPFANSPAHILEVKKWAQGALHPSQLDLVQKSLYYPTKEIVSIRESESDYADYVARFMKE